MAKSGFTYDSDSGKWETMKGSSPSNNTKVTVKGECFVGINLKLSCVVLHEKICSISLPIKIGFKITGESTIADIDLNTGNLESAFIDLGNEDTYHTCHQCISGKVDFVFEVSVQLKLLFVINVNTDICKWDWHIFDWYYSRDNHDWGLTKCPYKAYKTTFKVLGNSDYSAYNQKITIDNVSRIANGGEAVFHCANGTHNYTITDTVSGKVLKSGSFVVNNATKIITATFSANGGDSISINVSDVTKYEYTSPKDTNNDEDLPVVDEIQTISAGKLGDNIAYILYKDGFMWIYGYGEMYNSSNIISSSNKSKIREVLIENQDETNNEVITNIGDYMFFCCTNLAGINIPNSITTIGAYAFSDISLHEINIPDSVTSKRNIF